jgi:hypothetical protein
MSNSLTRKTALSFMPLFLRILLRHYYNKLGKKRSRENASAAVVPLRREELMYDEAFSIVRVSYPFPSIWLCMYDIHTPELYGRNNRVSRSSPILSFTVLMTMHGRHTIEELQKFSQLRLPAPPSAYVVRLSVPLSCCADAARVLIEVFGGEREVKRTVGGVRWWQVRSGNHGCVLVSST